MCIQVTILVMVVMILLRRPCPQQLKQDSPLLRPVFGTGDSIKLPVPINCSKLVAGDEGGDPEGQTDDHLGECHVR